MNIFIFTANLKINNNNNYYVKVDLGSRFV